MLKIKKLSLKDLWQVLEISRASFKKPWPKSEFEKHLNSSFAAEDSDKIAGFVVGKIKGYSGVLKLIAVNPNFRGRGVGRGLMEHIFDYFKKGGAKKIVAHSRLHNKAGCAFLKNFGFKKTEIIKNYYFDGEDAYLMVKKLDG